MIKNSFIFLEKVGPRKEQAWWQSGIKDWQDFMKAGKVKGIAASTKSYYDRRIHQAQQALLKDDAAFFVGKLPAKETWRLYDYFKEETGFLDVEVDSHGKIIVVGISNYYQTNTFVNGVNLEKNLLEKELSKYKVVVTFNGASFDLPKLKKQLKVEFKGPHIDLKPLSVALGLKGGLKEAEKRLGLKRPAHLYGNPVGLWNAFHASGDREYLELLLEYNQEDIENLKQIMEYVYKEKSNKIYKRMNNSEEL